MGARKGMQKPLCPKCDQNHWRFLRCDEVDAATAREVEARRRREANVPLIRLHEGRSALQAPEPVMLVFEQLAPGVYVRPNAARPWKGVG